MLLMERDAHYKHGMLREALGTAFIKVALSLGLMSHQPNVLGNT